MRIRVFLIGVLVLLALVTWVAFKSAKRIGVEVPRAMIPPPLVARIARTNAPLRIFPGVTGALILLPDGSLWSWGGRRKGLSAGLLTPVQIGTNCDWLEVFAANNHTVGLRADGSIWEWGLLADGRLATKPAQVGLVNQWVGIAAGDAHAVAVRRDGTLWSWGDNSMLQLGNGPGPSQSTPVQVGTNRNWKAVTCGQGSLHPSPANRPHAVGLGHHPRVP